MNKALHRFLEEELMSSGLNRLPGKYGGGPIFAPPLTGVSRGDDPIFETYKRVVSPRHLMPFEMWEANGLRAGNDHPSRLRILSIVFPYVRRIRDLGGEAENIPAEIYCVGRNYANACIRHIQKTTEQYFESMGYRALAAILSPAFQIHLQQAPPQFCSVWSERHVAFAAGLGTFSLHEGLITEAGCNVRLASVMTDAPLDVSIRAGDDPYANCLYYARGECRECERRCPAGAITKAGHDKVKCRKYGEFISRKMNPKLAGMLKPHQRNIAGIGAITSYPVGCAFCQFRVPCMDRNPVGASK